MSLMKGKKGLIMGVANERSIAWGISQKLAAAGAPSEFSIRAPLLGGITTVFVRFEQGPRGVFLLVDDEDNDPKIGDQVQFAIRRIYAQEGYIRYGLKCQIIRE